jgi:hypothetical protein
MIDGVVILINGIVGTTMISGILIRKIVGVTTMISGVSIRKIVGGPVRDTSVLEVLEVVVVLHEVTSLNLVLVEDWIVWSMR